MHTVAAVLREYGSVPEVEEVELGEPEPGELLVRIAGVGICHTDLAAIDGTPPLPLPVVLGHEGAGVVERVGEGVTAAAPGDRVVLSYDHCDACARCTAGHPAYCEDFFARNASGRRPGGGAPLRQGDDPVHGRFCGQSSFAGHVLAAEACAVPVGDDAPLELLGPLGCSLLTGAGTVLGTLEVPAGASLAVYGAGAVGLAAVMAGAVAGADPLVVVDPAPARRELALGLGATHALDPADGSVTRVLRGGADFALEAVGHPDVVAAAVRGLASPGVCATVGFRGSPNPVTIDQGRLLYGRTLTGVIEGDVVPGEFIPRLLELHRTGRFGFERLIETFPFAAIAEALDAARRGAVVKPVLVLDGA